MKRKAKYLVTRQSLTPAGGSYVKFGARKTSGNQRIKGAKVVDVKGFVHIDVRYGDGTNEGIPPKDQKHAQAVADHLEASKGQTLTEALEGYIAL